MSRGSDGGRKILRTLTKSSSSAHVCQSCRTHLSRRGYASAAAAKADHESSSINQTSDTAPTESSAPQPRVDIKAGIVLSRPPLITPDPHPFEAAYHLYQRRLNERLVLPFTQYFYFRKGTPAFDHWKARRTARGGVATRDIGKYNAYSKEGWNDEVVMGDQSGQPEDIVRQLVEEEGRGEEFGSDETSKKMAGLRRTTEADTKNDQKSLERKLSRTLYLLVKNSPISKGQPDDTLWRFPSGALAGKEGLKEAAQRILGSSCGINMNTWFVGNHPVGHYVQDLKALRETKKDAKLAEDSTDIVKTFFMKARIMAGQADLSSSAGKVEDFKWLSKDEIEKLVSRGYWSSIKNMLVEQ